MFIKQSVSVITYHMKRYKYIPRPPKIDLRFLWKKFTDHTQELLTRKNNGSKYDSEKGWKVVSIKQLLVDKRD